MIRHICVFRISKIFQPSKSSGSEREEPPQPPKSSKGDKKKKKRDKVRQILCQLSFSVVIQACRSDVEVAGWTVDQKTRVRFPAYPHRVWAFWWQGGKRRLRTSWCPYRDRLDTLKTPSCPWRWMPGSRSKGSLTIRPFSSPLLKTTLVNCSTFAFLFNFQP